MAHLTRIVAIGVACGAAACTSAPPPKEPATAVTTTAAEPAASAPRDREITTEPVVECDLVCERARIDPRPDDAPDYHRRATANANAVLEAMHPELLDCYRKRVAVNPRAHAFITVDVLIGEDGRVRDVETTGGALLGDETMTCIVQRIRGATFEPPHGGGTLRVHVPFTLQRAGVSGHAQ